MNKPESHGVYYSAFDLLQDARLFDDLGKLPALTFHRDSTGRIDGIELLTAPPPTEPCPACKGEGGHDIGGCLGASFMPCLFCHGEGMVPA